MATTSILGTTVFNTNAGNKTITATPAVGDIIVIVGANSGRTTAQAPTVTDNNTDGHGTYVLITSCTKNTSADSMWAYIRADSIQKAASTVFTWATASDTGGGFAIFKTTGLTLAALAAVRQSAVQSNQAAGATGPTMPNACLTGNPAITAVFNATNTSGVTQPTSWTADTDQGHTVPAAGFRGAFRSSGNTLTTISWATNSASAFCTLAVELKADQGNLAVTLPYERVVPALDAVRQSANWMRRWENTIGGAWGRRKSGVLVPAYSR